MLCCSSGSVLSFSIKHLNMNNTTLLSVLFLALLPCYWNISACLWLAYYQPLLFPWLELNKMCANFLLFHVPCMREGASSIYEIMMERHLLEECLRQYSPASLAEKLCKHTLGNMQVQLMPKGPLAPLLRCPSEDTSRLCPLALPSTKHSQCHLPTRAGITFLNC